MTWDNNSVEIDKMTVKEFLDYLTDINWHTERVLVEAIIDGRGYLIDEACEVRSQHQQDGYMTDQNLERRLAIIKALNEE